MATVNEVKDAKQGEKNKRLRMSVTPMEFPELIETSYVDTVGCCSLINNLLRPIFPDYFGSKIEIAQNKQLITSIFFVDKNIDPGEGQFKAIEQFATKDKLNSDVDTRIQLFNRTHANIKRQNMLQLTKEAKDMLFDIVPRQAFDNKGKVNWNNITTEGSAPIGGMFNNQIYLQVTIDLSRVLKIVYGSKAEDGGNLSYQIIIGNPINPMRAMSGAVMANKWQMFIMRINDKDVDALANEYGYIAMGGNNLGIVSV